jgi:hypothetical protein
VPELSDTVYTRDDFLVMCDEQIELATQIFQGVDWQHPESYVDEQFIELEWDECPNCGRWYDRYGDETKHCKFCGGELKYEGDEL